MTPRRGAVSRFVAVSLLAAALGACASASGGAPGEDDDSLIGDAALPAETPDASPGTPDAAPGAPDAHPGAPDAHPGVPDASPPPPPPPDASSGVACESGATCQAAQTLASISGDTGNQKQTAQGYQSAWYKIRVTEDDSGIFGVSTSAEVKLTSPIGTDFDLFVYLNANSDVSQECSMIYGTKTVNGNVETVLADWGEGNGGFSNGSNDGRTMSIEIRPAASTCSVGQMWQLEVTGNQ